MSITHTHYCKHCDRTFSHTDELALDDRPVIARTCVEMRDISKIHACDEAMAYRKAVAIRMSMSDKGCIMHCGKEGCSHVMTKSGWVRA